MPRLVNLAQSRWRSRFLDLFIVFLKFHHHWTNLTPFHTRMICAKFGWNWPSGFALFHYYLALEKGRALLLNKLGSPSPQDSLCQVWLKLDQWFWRRRWKCVKLTTTTTTSPMKMTTDNRQIVIKKAHLSLRLRWTKNHSKCNHFISSTGLFQQTKLFSLGHYILLCSLIIKYFCYCISIIFSSNITWIYMHAFISSICIQFQCQFVRSSKQ